MTTDNHTTADFDADDLVAAVEHDDEAEPGIETPLRSIRAACLRCQGATDKPRREHREAVAECPTVTCPLHAMRFGRRPDPATCDPTSPVRPLELGKRMADILGHHRQRRTAMRMQCLDCVGYQRREIAACTTWRCPIYPFRLGPSHTVDRGNVDERRALWHRIGHEAFVEAMNELLCSGQDDGAVEPVDSSADGVGRSNSSQTSPLRGSQVKSYPQPADEQRNAVLEGVAA